jgi:hypothetical protein
MANKGKKKKVLSNTIAGLIPAFEALGMVKNRWGNGSVAVRLPGYAEFVRSLPKDEDCSSELKLFRNVTKGMEKLIDLEAGMTYCLHLNGSIGIYGKVVG